nr:bifunctional fucokinase/fucose-1-phosphate guanylyltransferase [Maribellus maritimus]
MINSVKTEVEYGFFKSVYSSLITHLYFMKHLISLPPNVVKHFHSISGLSPDNWFVASDPENKRVGSGGGTSYILSEMWETEKTGSFEKWLTAEKRMIVHAGGNSRRLPAYAPVGKSLMPMPVFRWSRGQDLSQRLIHLQVPLFEQILEKAPERLNTLVASGDTLIFSEKTVPEIPDADVVCFGMWLEPEKATHHGVFFTQSDAPDKLQFMLQKPSISKIRDLIQSYYFLMDIGIWLLSPKAVQLLMQKSGWDGSKYKNTIPDEYDLYSEFGISMGNNPEGDDNKINALKVAVVNLEGGEFYHLGNTSELVSSNLAIQNRVTDQREIWHKRIKPHPSIFTLNADTHVEFSIQNKNIWIENSSIPATWSLTENHTLTGVPENTWKIELAPGACLDFVPLGGTELVIRNYGYSDPFRGGLNDPDTRFMEEPLQQWLAKRKLSEAFDTISPETDIHHVPLFPVVAKKDIQQEFIQWLLEKNPKENKTFSEQWILSKRMSAAGLSEACNLQQLEKQRKRNHIQNLEFLAKNHKRSVFYQLDLKRLAQEYAGTGLSLPPVLEDTSSEWTPIHDQMFRAACLRLKDEDASAYEEKSFLLLRNNVLRPFYQNTVDPRINLLPDQIAWGRSPVRLDMAGGWTDTPPYCMLHGGKVLNVAVELNGQPPLHCYVRAIEKTEIVLRSIDLGAREVLTTFEEVNSFTKIQSAFSIPKAALALAGFLPEFSTRKFSSLKEQLEHLQSGLEITILSAVPKGSGLGTSSILAATVLGTLSEVCCLKWDKQEIGNRTLALEQLLTTGGGWQDQYGGLYEGIKLLETIPGKQQLPRVKWLPDSLFCDPFYKKRMLLYYTGITRVAKNILAEIVRGMFLNSRQHLSVLEEMKQHTEQTYEAILQKDFDRLGDKIAKSWQLNQKLDEGTNTTEIQRVIEMIEPYILSQKLLGAGGGGFMFILAKDEAAANLIKTILQQNPTNKRARFVDFKVSQTGLQVTKS